ncbi:hypothetical protein [Schleiferilactobacillus shenzhenensis]|uniref:hypothetical protein n=1 Tax=Schleiferilactobacillus shenzhenensis TaxID=1231337 RepID=UPI0005912EAD|nr:hypothetical protein [Schleiferilactobacillus shenzhenensis]
MTVALTAMAARPLLTFGELTQVAETAITLVAGAIGLFRLNQTPQLHRLERVTVTVDRLQLIFCQPFNDLTEVSTGETVLPITAANRHRSVFWVHRPQGLADGLPLILRGAAG